MINQDKSGHWRRIFEQFEAAEENVTVFCHKNKISRAQFLYWRKKFEKNGRYLPDLVPQKAFLALKAHPEASLAIKLSNGMELRFSSLPDASWVAQLMDDMEGRDADL